jgi:glycosyltransferase involved in cell wall biosynthesis
MRKVPVISLQADIDVILEQGKVGFICHSFNNLLEIIRLLIKNVPLRDEMGMAAQHYAFQNFSIEANISKLIPVFSD